MKISYNGYTFQNTEAAFQAQKDLSRINEFVNLDPRESKRLGRRVKLRTDWEQVKDFIMYEICKAKFTQNLDLRIKLLKTYDATLIEGNTWGDTYWGVCKGRGKNKLGITLMKIREELK